MWKWNYQVTSIIIGLLKIHTFVTVFTFLAVAIRSGIYTIFSLKKLPFANIWCIISSVHCYSFKFAFLFCWYFIPKRIKYFGRYSGQNFIAPLRVKLKESTLRDTQICRYWWEIAPIIKTTTNLQPRANIFWCMYIKMSHQISHENWAEKVQKIWFDWSF